MSYTRYKLNDAIEVWFEEDQTVASEYGSYNWVDALINYIDDYGPSMETININSVFELTVDGTLGEPFDRFMESKLDSAKGRTREIIKDYLDWDEREDDRDTLFGALSVSLSCCKSYGAGVMHVNRVELMSDSIVFHVFLDDFDERGGYSYVVKTGDYWDYGDNAEFRDVIDGLEECELKDFLDEIGPLPGNAFSDVREWSMPSYAERFVPTEHSVACKIPLSKFTVTEGLSEIKLEIEPHEDEDENEDGWW